MSKPNHSTISQETVQSDSSKYEKLKNHVKARELYVRLVRFDSRLVNEPRKKIRVADFGVCPTDKSPSKTDKCSGKSESRKSYVKVGHSQSSKPHQRTGTQGQQNTTKPQGFTSLAAKLMHAHFVRSPNLQSILKDVLLLRRDYNNPISDSSIENEIKTVKKQYNLSYMDSLVMNELEEVTCQSDDSESVSNVSANAERSPTTSFSSSTTLGGKETTKKPEDNVMETEKTNSNSSTLEVELSNGLVFELDPKIVECPICAKSFQAIHTLKQHLKFCFISSSTTVKTEPTSCQNETPGHFVVKQELSFESPVNIQQVFSSDNLPSELGISSNSSNNSDTAWSQKNPEFITKKPFNEPPELPLSSVNNETLNIKQELPGDTLAEVNLFGISAEESERIFSNLKQTEQSSYKKLLYHCCVCNYSSSSAKTLLLHCSETIKCTKGKSVACRACNWKNPSEPFFLAHNEKFRSLSAQALKCSNCRGFLYNHDMFLSHEVRKECGSAPEIVLVADIPTDSEESDEDDCVIID